MQGYTPRISEIIISGTDRDSGWNYKTTFPLFFGSEQYVSCVTYNRIYGFVNYPLYFWELLD